MEQLTIDHRTRLNEAIRCCDEYALRSALIGYLVANAWADDCLFFLTLLNTKLEQEGKSTWGAGELAEEIHHYINN
jgi:hypothetical protein